MSLDPAAVRRIARLARIHVEEDAIGQLQAELGSILGWIEQLNEVDVDGVAPLTGAAQMALRLRDDVVTDGGNAEGVLANAPDRAGRVLRRAESGGMMLTDLTLTDLTLTEARDGLRGEKFLVAPK